MFWLHLFPTCLSPAVTVTCWTVRRTGSRCRTTRAACSHTSCLTGRRFGWWRSRAETQWWTRCGTPFRVGTLAHSATSITGPLAAFIPTVNLYLEQYLLEFIQRVLTIDPRDFPLVVPLRRAGGSPARITSSRESSLNTYSRLAQINRLSLDFCLNRSSWLNCTLAQIGITRFIVDLLCK